MNRSEARTDEGWKRFDLWATFAIPALVIATGLLLWWRGYGAGAAPCCGAVPTPTPAIAPQAAPAHVVPVPATPAPAATAPAAPSIDCASIVNGVSVGFAVNRAELTAAGKRSLDQTIGCLASGRYEVAGHTDSDGDEKSNQRLSLARAQTAIRYLTSKQIDPASLAAAGYGESRPIADNSTPEGKAKNRRITFTPKP